MLSAFKATMAPKLDRNAPSVHSSHPDPLPNSFVLVTMLVETLAEQLSWQMKPQPKSTARKAEPGAHEKPPSDKEDALERRDKLLLTFMLSKTGT